MWLRAVDLCIWILRRQGRCETPIHTPERARYLNHYFNDTFSAAFLIEPAGGNEKEYMMKAQCLPSTHTLLAEVNEQYAPDGLNLKSLRNAGAAIR